MSTRAQPAPHPGVVGEFAPGRPTQLQEGNNLMIRLKKIVASLLIGALAAGFAAGCGHIAGPIGE